MLDPAPCGGAPATPLAQESYPDPPYSWKRHVCDGYIRMYCEMIRRKPTSDENTKRPGAKAELLAFRSCVDRVTLRVAAERGQDEGGMSVPTRGTKVSGETHARCRAVGLICAPVPARQGCVFFIFWSCLAILFLISISTPKTWHMHETRTRKSYLVLVHRK